MISEINTKHCVSDWQTFCEYQMYLTNLYALMFFSTVCTLWCWKTYS